MCSFIVDQPMRKVVVKSRKIVLGCRMWCLRPGLFVHGGREVYLHTALGDWQTDLYNCIVILSQVVGFTIFPHSHVQSNKRPAEIYTTQYGWDITGCSAMPSSYIYAPHFQALWSSNSENYINSSSKKQKIKKVLLFKKSFLFYLILYNPPTNVTAYNCCIWLFVCPKIGKAKYTLNLVEE